ncbi:MAG TPA: YciI family protein [Terriglobales bacterium]|nr:YciI family protein [Terriglobales bacterium]
MRYMFLVYSVERADMEPAILQSVAEQHRKVMSEAAQRGVFESAEPLKPTTTATTIRSNDGQPVLLDGPFAETKEQLAGYYILNCKDLDEAIEWAKKIPSGCKGGQGCIEIRPLHEGLAH